MPPAGVVKRAVKSNRVPQPPFLATVAAGGPAGGAPGSPCLVAFHHGETALGYFNASGFDGASAFTPNLQGGPGSLPNAPQPPDLALYGNGWAIGPNGGAVPAARMQLQNHGFNNGAYPGLTAAPATGQRVPIARAAGIDGGQCATTGMWKYNQSTDPTPPPAGAARQGRRLEVHDVRTGAVATVPVTDSGTGHLRGDVARRFGWFCHVRDLLGRDAHLQQLRNAAAMLGRRLIIKCHFVRLTPDAEVCETQLPNGDRDAWAALYGCLAGPGASRASWDALGLRNLYAVLLGGPDAYTTKSWYATVANGGARLQRCNEAGAAAATPANRGSHVHLVYITVEQSAITAADATTPAAQTALDQLHRFHRRCAMGDDELVEATNGTEINLFNYWQECGNSATSDVKVFGYACVGKNNCRHKTWRGPANWARSVLHTANLQTEWSELIDTLRSVVGRTAAVVRMPFCVPGNAAAMAALPHIPQAY